MEYTKSIGDMYETYSGTPEEIANLIELVEGTETINEDDLIDFIDSEIGIGKKIIQRVLDLETEYLKLKGIAE